MTSKVKICNLALARLGINSITSLTDNTIEAKMCNLMYDDVAKEVMADNAFSSTLFRQELNVTDNTPEFGFAYEYQLPTNPKCLRVLNIDDYDAPGAYAFNIEGDKLLADVTPVKIRYIGYITDSDAYDEQLKRCIISKLAADLAYTLTGSAPLAEALYTKYSRDLADAKSIDGQQGSSQVIVSSDLNDVR